MGMLLKGAADLLREEVAPVIGVTWAHEEGANRYELAASAGATAAHLAQNEACMAAARSFVGVYSVAKSRTVRRSTCWPSVLKPCPRCAKDVLAIEARDKAEERRYVKRFGHVIQSL